MASCDNWESVILLTSFQVNCGYNESSPAITLAPNNYGTQDLLILCNDDFGPGPYSVERIVNVDAMVKNEEISSCVPGNFILILFYFY
jgi:hypothetical protein